MRQKIYTILRWGFAALLLVVIYQTIRIGWAGWSVYQDVTTLRQHLSDDVNLTQIALPESEIVLLSEHLTELHHQVQPTAFLLERLAWIPAYGATIAALPDLTRMGHEGGQLAKNLYPLWAETVVSLDDDQTAALLLKNLSQREQTLTPHIAALEEAANQVPATAFPTNLADRWVQVQTGLPIVSSAMQLIPQATQLLGFEEPQTYLVLLQNNHELRATGGFIASVGEITLTNGKLGNFRFMDSYDIFHFEPPYPPLPLPMQTYMDIETLYLRDANWSPHLPTTARLVRDLYFLHTGARATGVVTVDLHAVTLLVEALQPVYIQERDEPVTAENVLDVVLSFWNQPPEITESDEWWVSRKDFIPFFVDGAMAAAKAKGIANIALAQAMQEALDRRFIQAWVDDPDVGLELAELGWDGALHPSKNADYLALVDSNLGFNKADAVLQRTIDYAVNWPDQGVEQRARATVTVTYEHTLEKPEHECDITPRYGSEGAVYDEMFERCYFGYPRLYAPMGSELIAIKGVEEESAISQRGELRTQVFAGYFIMEPGQQHQVTFEYWLPSTIVADGYELTVQRQAGLEKLPLNLNIQDQEIALDLTEGIVHWDDF